MQSCRRRFIETYDPPPSYSDEFKRDWLKLYVNGMGFQAIERYDWNDQKPRKRWTGNPKSQIQNRELI